MLFNLALAAVGGSALAAAAPAPQVADPIVGVSGWTVRADWSRCSNASASEVVLAGQIAATGTVVGTGIVEFEVPPYGFDGSLVLKPAGSIGFGSPYPPDKVDVKLLEEADADGNWGFATYTPAAPGQGGSSEKIANVLWFTDKNNSINPTSEITYAELERRVELSISTKKTPSFLRVYYCSYPASP